MSDLFIFDDEDGEEGIFPMRFDDSSLLVNRAHAEATAMDAARTFRLKAQRLGYDPEGDEVEEFDIIGLAPGGNEFER